MIAIILIIVIIKIITTSIIMRIKRKKNLSGGPSGANAVVRPSLFDPKDRTAVLSGLELQL